MLDMAKKAGHTGLAEAQKKLDLLKAVAKSAKSTNKRLEAVGAAMVAETTEKIKSIDKAKLLELAKKVDCDKVSEQLDDSTISMLCEKAKTDEAAGRKFLGTLWGKGVAKTKMCVGQAVMKKMAEGENLYADEAATIGALKTCAGNLSKFFPEAVFPSELTQLTAPTTKPAEAEMKKVAAKKSGSGSAFIVASGATLAAFALF